MNVSQRNKLINRARKRAAQGKTVRLSSKLEGCLVAIASKLEEKPNDHVWLIHVNNGQFPISLGRYDSLSGNHDWWRGSDVVVIDSNFKL